MERAILSFFILAFACYNAYSIRLYAVRDYGRVIHEFDPWFNYRATEYLHENGWNAFFSWYDRQSWYPMGRPIGTTIYPGMQIFSVLIHAFCNHFLFQISLNDVCVFVPAIFSIFATVIIFFLALNATNFDFLCASFVSLLFSVVPAHLMRSVAGGFDNESVAMTFLLSTFLFYSMLINNCRKSNARMKSVFIGTLCGFSYICMVMSWGGFIFVLNLMTSHLFLLTMIFPSSCNESLVLGYSFFFIIGTLGAIHVPIVGMQPFKSMEQLSGLFVFLYLWLRLGIQKAPSSIFLAKCAAIAMPIAGMLIKFMYDDGFFAPFSVRVKALFVEHTKTGNPLVDSVAEHQPANAQAYTLFFPHIFDLSKAGFVILLISVLFFTRNSASSSSQTFMLHYALISYFLCNKMSRLVLLMSPATSFLAALPFTLILDHTPILSKFKAYKALVLVGIGYFFLWHFHPTCMEMAERMSNPSIMFKATLTNGQDIIVDDYREAYFWLRDETELDSRVLSWWDYGYQITGIGQRTTLADGNTNNHEHIATIGRMLTMPNVTKAHSIIRHLADYVLVWTGGGGDDMAKAGHMIRIGNSVFPPNTATKPSQIQLSLLYNLCNTNKHEKLFRQVFRSKYDKVRIFEVMDVSEESKTWVMRKKNRICNEPWACVGQYPPAIEDFISTRRDFNQRQDPSTLMQQQQELQAQDEESRTLKMVGCYKSDQDFTVKESLKGVTIGAHILEALTAASERGSKFVAISRSDATIGDVLFLDTHPAKAGKDLDKGCKKPCSDHENIYCGCQGKLCGKKAKTSTKRWIVYQV